MIEKYIIEIVMMLITLFKIVTCVILFSIVSAKIIEYFLGKS